MKATLPQHIKLEEREHVEKPLLDQLAGLGWEVIDLTDMKQTPADTCPSRIRCQAATGSWTKSRQWETQRTLFSSARATMCPPTKVDGVWPFNDAWLRTSLSEAWKSPSVRSRSRAFQNSIWSRYSRRVVPIRHSTNG